MKLRPQRGIYAWKKALLLKDSISEEKLTLRQLDHTVLVVEAEGGVSSICTVFIFRWAEETLKETRRLFLQLITSVCEAKHAEWPSAHSSEDRLPGNKHVAF